MKIIARFQYIIVGFLIVFVAVPSCCAEIRILSCFGKGCKNPRNVYVEGNTAYTFNRADFSPGAERIKAWDISNPREVIKIGSYNQIKDVLWQAKPEAIKFEGYHGNAGGTSQTYYMGIGRFAGRLLAFVQPHHQGLQVLDITDPNKIYNMGGNPKVIQSHHGNKLTQPGVIKTSGNYIFQTSRGGFQVFEYLPGMEYVQEEAPYKFTSKCNYWGTPEGNLTAFDIEVSKDRRYLYVARSDTLDVYDISSIKNPKRVFRYADVQFPYSKTKNQGIRVEIAGNILLFGTLKDIRFFDISDHSAIRPIKNDAGNSVIYPGLGLIHDVKVYGKYAFIYFEDKTLGMEIVDISESSKPKFVDAVNLSESYQADTDNYYSYREAVLVPEKGIIIVVTGSQYCILDISEYVRPQSQWRQSVK
jgi:hypothetical protein